ncbi:MAG: SDR family oxidoreductase [Patescibacteria group bacterium]|jgi:dTDP-4-dehydrorhamnose reductase
MKKVLVLGSEGLLGSAIVAGFTGDFFVTAWDKSELDVTNKNEVLGKIIALAPDYIINATAYNGVDQAEKDEQSASLANKINCEAVGYLAEAAYKVGAPIVHFSTDYVFAGDSGSGYDEAAKPSPINKYGKSKADGEKILMEKTNKYYLVRLSRMFGPPGKSAAAKKSFVDQIIASAKGKEEMKLVDEEFSCATYSIDLAKFVKKLISTSAPFGIYHGANSGVSTWYTMTKEIFRIKNIDVKLLPIKSSDFPRVAKRPHYSELINSKLPIQRTWQEALEEYLK